MQVQRETDWTNTLTYILLLCIAFVFLPNIGGRKSDSERNKVVQQNFSTNINEVQYGRIWKASMNGRKR